MCCCCWLLDLRCPKTRATSNHSGGPVLFRCMTFAEKMCRFTRWTMSANQFASRQLQKQKSNEMSSETLKVTDLLKKSKATWVDSPAPNPKRHPSKISSDTHPPRNKTNSQHKTYNKTNHDNRNYQKTVKFTTCFAHKPSQKHVLCVHKSGRPGMKLALRTCLEIIALYHFIHCSSPVLHMHLTVKTCLASQMCPGRPNQKEKKTTAQRSEDNGTLTGQGLDWLTGHPAWGCSLLTSRLKLADFHLKSSFLCRCLLVLACKEVTTHWKMEPTCLVPINSSRSAFNNILAAARTGCKKHKRFRLPGLKLSTETSDMESWMPCETTGRCCQGGTEKVGEVYPALGDVKLPGDAAGRLAEIEGGQKELAQSHPQQPEGSP